MKNRSNFCDSRLLMAFSISSEFVVQLIGVNIYCGEEAKYRSWPHKVSTAVIAELRMLALVEKLY